MKTATLLVGLLLMGSCAVWAQGTTWQIRYAQALDQTDEWTAMGRIPAWEVKITPGEVETLEIGGDKQGAFRGMVLLGREWTVPTPMPGGLKVKLSYQTYCTLNAPLQRAGFASLVFMTPEQWSSFATDPKLAQRWNQTDRVATSAVIHSSGEDVTAWHEWQSPDLAARLRPYAGKKLMLVIVWGCNHFEEEWAKFTSPQVSYMTEEEAREEFIQSLNLDYDGMQQVKAAVERKDIKGAEAAFVAHMRQRLTPAPPPLSADGSPAAVRAAEEIVDHVFRFTNCPPYKLGEEIAWNEDPFNYDQWAIALNRHTHWLTLGRAYAATQDEKYAREFVAELRSWTEALPIYIGPRWIEGPMFEPGKSPLTLDGGIRMGQSWFPAYYYFKDSPSFDVDSQIAMFRSVRDHGRYLSDPQGWRPASNWGAMQVNGLLHVAVMMPEFKESAQWLQTAQSWLMEAMKQQVYPDGAQTELATGYHSVTLGNFLGALELARRTGVELPEEFVKGLEAMFEYFVAIAMPNGGRPSLNDGTWGSVRSELAKGFALFPNRKDFQYLATGGKEGTAPSKTSWLLPYAGWAVMRTGWGPGDRYLHFDLGPFGAGHQHEDKLSLIVHAGGKTILTEPGNYSYDTSDWRRYVLATRSHNTVLVDGQDQNRRVVRETHTVWEPKAPRWMTNAEWDFAEGSYEDGYGAEGKKIATHTRQVLFAKPDYWVVLDTMTPADAEEHTYEALFHLDAEQAVIDPATRSATVEYGGAEFRIVPLCPEAVEVQVIQGQTSPVVQGWLPTGQHNKLRPIPTVVYRWKARGHSTVGFAMIPKDAGADWSVEGIKGETLGDGALRATIALADGSRDLLLRRPGGKTAQAEGPLDTDATLAAVRLGAKGETLRTFQVDGTRLEVRAE
jgi:hypothetical protein